MVFLHMAETLISPPARYPDLFPVLNVLVSAGVFTSVWLWSIKRGVEIAWTLSGPPKVRQKDSKDRERRKSLRNSSSSARLRRRSTQSKATGEVFKDNI